MEATHSKFDKFIKVHNYQVRNVESSKAGENLLKAVKHFNSYNLWKTKQWTNLWVSGKLNNELTYESQAKDMSEN